MTLYGTSSESQHGDHTDWCVDLGDGKNLKDGNLNLELRSIQEADVVASADCLPFKDDYIDVIHANSLTPHFDNLNAAFGERSSILQPGSHIPRTLVW